jgi:hypothetical protein
MKRFSLTLLLLFSVSFGFAQPRDTTVKATLEFVVNTDHIIHNDYYNIFTREVIPYLQANKESISFALIEGSASPEGRPEMNLKLAEMRANCLKTYLADVIPEDKIFSKIIKVPQSEVAQYPKLRSAKVEVHLLLPKVDTVYKDTLIERVDTVFIEPSAPPLEPSTTQSSDRLVISISNDLIGDFAERANIGLDIYFHTMSFFVEGSFSFWPFFGKPYNITVWHTGLREYFNKDYNKLFAEVYGRVGWFDIGDTGIFYGGGLGIGYKIDLGKYWKIYPIFRLGFDNYNVVGTGAGEINISFGNYVAPTETQPENRNQIRYNATSDEHYNVYWFGPTYLGLTIQRNFYFKK